MIYISELSKTFSGQKVLNNLSLEIQKGEVVALIGSSGAGKSTFLRSLNYLEAPDSGRIKIDDFEVDFEHISQDQILTLRRKLAMVYAVSCLWFSNSLICLVEKQPLKM